ncbi:SDR family oxidoreductase [Microbacterium sp. 1.5R]|uniref:SDR family oxidoreductase n=1 Tax=Microbacterium sp. 1.5R TaxID=1916917 RepID=UPI0011A077B2|nr:SDR family oxidoreductase [Microbacterium sp. 1.5R]
MSAGVTWVLGGGSGIGRGAAVSLAASADVVVVSGRRAEELQRTVDAVRAAGGRAVALAVDVGDEDAVAQAAERIHADHGPVRTLVYSAGTNVRNRFWEDTTPQDFARVVDINLTGAMRAVHAVLPGMRTAGDGLVVLVSSWAGWRFAPGVGAGYSTSKTAMGALAETVNAQERLHGIRATHFCPGEVATEILDTRPNPPSAAERELMLTADDVGDAIRWIADLPARICVNEIVFTPTSNTSYA